MMKHSTSGSKKQRMYMPDVSCKTLAVVSSQAQGLLKFSWNGLFAAAVSFLPVLFHESREFWKEIGIFFWEASLLY